MDFHPPPKSQRYTAPWSFTRRPVSGEDVILTSTTGLPPVLELSMKALSVSRSLAGDGSWISTPYNDVEARVRTARKLPDIFFEWNTVRESHEKSLYL